MARNRMIKPDFWQDEKICNLNPLTRLLYISLWNFADDEGLLRWTPELIKSQSFLYDDIDIKPLMQELVDNDLVISYQSVTYKGDRVQKYAWLINFSKHQKIDRKQPSKLPAPTLSNYKIRDAYFKRDKWICHICKEECTKLHTGDMSMLASIDHVKSKFDNGNDYPSNIKTAHLKCNMSKGHKSMVYDCDEQFDELSSNNSLPKEKEKEKENVEVETSANVNERARTQINYTPHHFEADFNELKPKNYKPQILPGNSYRDFLETFKKHPDRETWLKVIKLAFDSYFVEKGHKVKISMLVKEDYFTKILNEEYLNESYKPKFAEE